MTFTVHMVWLDTGKEEAVECDGYAMRINADVLVMQIGSGTTIRYRVEHLSQFRSINIEPNGRLQ